MRSEHIGTLLCGFAAKQLLNRSHCADQAVLPNCGQILQERCYLLTGRRVQSAKSLGPALSQR